MDRRELASSLARELWPGGHSVVTCDEVFARVREMNRQRFEIGSILDAAGVEEDVEHPRRVARLSAERARCLMMCADAQNKTGDLIGQLEAARGDLRVERERSEMLEKKLAGQQSNVDEAQRRAKAMIEEGDKVRSVLALHGANTLTDQFDPLSAVVGRVLNRLVKERDEARELCSLMTAERDTLAARVEKMNDEGEKVRDLLETYRHNKQNDLFNPLSFIVRRTLEDKDQQLTDLRKELAMVRAERDGIAKERTNSLNGKLLDEVRRATGCLLFGDNLVAAIKAMKDELVSVTRRMNEWRKLCEDIREAAGAREKESVIYAVKALRNDAEFGRAALEHAKALGIDANKELGQQYRALRRDAEAWRNFFGCGSDIRDEASKIEIRFHFLDKDAQSYVVKDSGAPEYSSTAVNPAKPGLQPLKCPCGGKIEFGCERVGHCLTCGASCRAMDPPPAIPDPDVREMPFERVTMAPPDTDDQSLTDALVEANLYKKLWRERAQKCQQALRRIRALTGDMSFALDEDWGADDDS